MPRQQRMILADVAVHIVQRGNNRGACFFGPGDYRLYLVQLRGLAKNLACAVHAYCLMTNHVHLLVTPPSAAACVALMRNLGQRYVQYINRTYGRTGTLWEGRYRSCPAESARYVLACYRYIELNPVRAAIADDPADYPWSSYHANADAQASSWLTPHPEYLDLGGDSERRKAAYRAMVHSELAPKILNDIRQATGGGYPLGSEEFKTRLSKTLGRRVHRGRAGRPLVNRGQPICEHAAKSGSDPEFRSVKDIGL